MKVPYTCIILKKLGPKLLPLILLFKPSYILSKPPSTLDLVLFLRTTAVALINATIVAI